jgi:hypothetical protein
MQSTKQQIIVFGYHKAGTVLFERIMRRVSELLGRSIAKHFGMVSALDRTKDIVLLPHSLLACDVTWPYRAIRVVRDPRDIWVSGYLYHRRCREGWCVNTNFDPTPPIGYPRVDFSFQHYPEEWKQNYLTRLRGVSYQQNLLCRSQEDALNFELEGYTGCTLEAMRAWRLQGRDIIDVKLEDIVENFDDTMRIIFSHLGFQGSECDLAVRLAGSEDMARMDDATLARNPHIHSRQMSKWRDTLSPAQVATFEQRYGSLITSLGYTQTKV